MLSAAATLGARARAGAAGRRGLSAAAVSVQEEIKMLENLLAEARARAEGKVPDAEVAAAAAGLRAGGKMPKFNIGTFNAISAEGMAVFPQSRYTAVAMASPEAKKEEIHAVLLRSHKLQNSDVPDTVRAVARCGSGVNNIDLAAMTERGIPVFNTPGANANAVKELAVCALLLASRGIIEGIEHQKKAMVQENNDAAKVKKRMEKEKAAFVGREVQGKKLGVIGLGHIGASVANSAIALGMQVIGYDPSLSLDAAWRLPGDVLQRATSLKQLVHECDYISLHVPYMKETHHLISGDLLKLMKPTCHVINFARGELVDTQAMRNMYDSGDRTGRYIADFADEFLHSHPKVVLMPHLGASTAEAEENAAAMAAKQVMEFIETGQIVNSVNFPQAKVERLAPDARRICIVNKNVPGMLGLITSTLGRRGVNIAQIANTSRENIAYNIVDIANTLDDNALLSLQEELSKLEGVVSSRVLGFGKPGMFRVNAANK